MASGLVTAKAASGSTGSCAGSRSVIPVGPFAPYPATRALSAVMAAVQTRYAGCTMADWSVTSLFINDTHANKSRASRRKHGSFCVSADFYVSAGGLRVDAYAIFHAQIREMVAYVTYAAFSREMNAGRILGQADVHIPLVVFASTWRRAWPCSSRHISPLVDFIRACSKHPCRSTSPLMDWAVSSGQSPRKVTSPLML